MPQQQYFNPATGKPVYFDPATGKQVEEPGQKPPAPSTGQPPGRMGGPGPNAQRPRIGGRAVFQSTDPDEPIVEPNTFEKFDKFMQEPLTTLPSRAARKLSNWMDPNDPL